MADKPSLEQVSITALKGVGPKLEEKLARLSIHSIQDVLFHLPLRYQDRTKITPIAAARQGLDAVIEGEIRAADIVFGKRRSLVARLQDGSGTITLRFFHFSNAQKDNLKVGARIRCFGVPRRGSSGLELYHPEYQFTDDNEQLLDERLTPIYPTTEGLSQQSWRKLAAQAVTFMQRDSIIEHIPSQLLASIDISEITLEQALAYLHTPPSGANVSLLSTGMHPFQRRLAFEELLAHNLSLQQQRQQTKLQLAPALSEAGQLTKQFLKQLPFSLTAAQQRVSNQINQDLATKEPMLRLIQGDVGSGKTVVAALAALRAIHSNYQVALMAPTEILAEQHFLNFSQWLEPLGIKLAWLAGKLKVAERRAQLAAIASGEAGVIIGTHALFQDDVCFAKLALVIIDEQHRFGVHQRLALKEKANATVGLPHQLIMTATPIPRTLAMSAYADLDTSIIDELPPGRTPINTVVLDNGRRPEVIERINQACKEGKQAYWVCTLIEESESLSAQAAEETCKQLTEALPEITIGLVHGRMKSIEKAEIMSAFKRGEIQLLVATTVIEVGVDVPNASLMIIENAERLGLAQLHQLRGRVGRGEQASHCLLMYQNPLSQLAKSRLQTMRESSDGFYIAEKDLELRGPGELLGTRQTGLVSMRIADLERDSDLLDEVNKVSLHIIHQTPEHVRPLIKRWLAGKEQFAQV